MFLRDPAHTRALQMQFGIILWRLNCELLQHNCRITVDCSIIIHRGDCAESKGWSGDRRLGNALWYPSEQSRARHRQSLQMSDTMLFFTHYRRIHSITAPLGQLQSYWSAFWVQLSLLATHTVIQPEQVHKEAALKASLSFLLTELRSRQSYNLIKFSFNFSLAHPPFSQLIIFLNLILEVESSGFLLIFN
jgi:hypothetical protein